MAAGKLASGRLSGWRWQAGCDRAVGSGSAEPGWRRPGSWRRAGSRDGGGWKVGVGTALGMAMTGRLRSISWQRAVSAGMERPGGWQWGRKWPGRWQLAVGQLLSGLRRLDGHGQVVGSQLDGAHQEGASRMGTDRMPASLFPFRRLACPGDGAGGRAFLEEWGFSGRPFRCWGNRFASSCFRGWPPFPGPGSGASVRGRDPGSGHGDCGSGSWVVASGRGPWSGDLGKGPGPGGLRFETWGR
jgi:hypothetical protein